MSGKQMRRYLFSGVLAVSLVFVGVNSYAAADAAEENAFIMSEEFQEIVIVDNDVCCFKITGVDTDNIWGYTWNVYAENKTDKALMFSFDDVAVNGYMCDPFWASEVASGMKENSEISWLTNEFESNGITDVNSVVFTLRVSDSDDWLADPYLETVYTVTADTEGMSEDENTAAPAASTDEHIIVDNENCYFSIKNMQEDDIWGYTWDVYLENRTDKTVTFSLNDVSVNGFVCDPFWASEVTPGMKANETVSWIGDSFEKNGITEVTAAEFVLRVSDSDDWLAEPIYEEMSVVYPLREEAVEVYQREPAENEVIVLDNENCTMIVTGFDEDEVMGYGMNIYLENKTDKKIIFSLADVAVNGYMCDPFWASSVPAGKRSNETVTWFSGSFEENGITQVESIVGALAVRDEDTYDDIAAAAMEITPW